MFGAGKTTLASRIAVGTAKLLAEHHEGNPFWGNDLAAEHVGYLPYDLAFLLHHIDLVTRYDDDGKPYVRVCDWSFSTDLLWASLRLGNDLAHYQAVHRALMQRIDPPIGWLYLRQPTEVILRRLELRGRKPETQLAPHVAAAVTALEEMVEKLPRDRLATVNDATSVEEIEVIMDSWTGARPNG